MDHFSRLEHELFVESRLQQSRVETIVYFARSWNSGSKDRREVSRCLLCCSINFERLKLVCIRVKTLSTVFSRFNFQVFASTVITIPRYFQVS